MSRGGRPVGEIRAALLRAVPAGGSTAVELARSVQVPVPVARYTLSRLADAGAVRVAGSAPAREGGGRPASVYALAESAGLVVFGLRDGED